MTDDTHKHEHVAVAINDLGDRLAMFRAPEFRHRFLACRGGGLQGVAGGTQVVRCARPRKSATGKGFPHPHRRSAFTQPDRRIVQYLPLT